MFQLNLCSKADPVVEEITIDETPTEVQLSVEPPPLELAEGTQLTEESAAPTSTAV